MGEWITHYNWKDLYNAEHVHKQANILQCTLLEQLNAFLPEKSFKISSDDKPWMTPEIKELDRNKKREYTKNRRSEKYCSMQQLYEDKVKVAKQNYYINIVQDLKAGNPVTWGG